MNTCQLERIENMSLEELKVEKSRAKSGLIIIGIITTLTFIAGIVNVYFDSSIVASIGVAFVFIPLIDSTRKHLKKIEAELQNRN